MACEACGIHCTRCGGRVTVGELAELSRKVAELERGRVISAAWDQDVRRRLGQEAQASLMRVQARQNVHCEGHDKQSGEPREHMLPCRKSVQLDDGQWLYCTQWENDHDGPHTFKFEVER